MAIIPVQSGNYPTATTFTAASAGGDAFENDATGILIIRDGAGLTLTVYSNFPGMRDKEFVLVGASEMMPRFDPLWWNDVDGLVRFEFSDPVGVTIAVIRSSIVRDDPDSGPHAGLF